MNCKERFPNWKKPEIIHGVPTKYGWTVLYPENLTLEPYTDIAAYVLINAMEGVTIGEGSQVGPFTSILSANTINNIYGKIKIGKNVRIGAYSLILPGVEIPDNVFIKAQSIVYRNLRYENTFLIKQNNG